MSLAFFACNAPSQDAHGSAAASAAGTPSAAPAKKPISALFPEKAPTIPSVYRGLTLGMSAEEAQKIVPDERKAIDAPEYPDLNFWISYSMDKKSMRGFQIGIPVQESSALVGAWGPPKLGQDTIRRPQKFWFNPAAKIRATLEPSLRDTHETLTLEAYIPLTDFLSDAGNVLTFGGKDPLGMSLDDLRATFPKYLVEKDQEKANDDSKDLEKILGEHKNKVKVFGKPKPSVYLDLPPVEYASTFTRVHFDFDGKGHVSSYRTGVEFRQYPDARVPILEALKTKFGAFKEVKRFGDAVLVFGKKGDVEVTEDTISHGWAVRISKPKK